MGSTGMARKVDDLGRIVLPVETRRLFGIQPGDALEISVLDGSIMLRKLEQTCVFCAGADEVTEYKGKLVCGPCLDGLQRGSSVVPAPDIGVPEFPEPTATL
jgi:AbrB family transcriptional regulator, transcriptional pleiotropic regulator of transition state genes